MVDNWLKFRQFLTLGHCLCCHRTLPLFDQFCSGCAGELPRIDAHCGGCGRSLPAGFTSHTLCGACQRHPLPFFSVRPLFYYRPPVSLFIHQMKYRNRLDLANALGTLLGDHLDTQSNQGPDNLALAADVIVPIPLHPYRLIQRGYNQALELARPVAKKLQLPLDYKTLVRVRHTKPQMELSPAGRAKNIKKAFGVVNNSLVGKRIALVDDVMTTGRTAEAATHALLKAEAASVECWVLARADG